MAMHGIKIVVSLFALLVTNVYAAAHGGMVVRLSHHSEEGCSEESLIGETMETLAVVTLKPAMFEAMGMGGMFPDDIMIIAECTDTEYVKTYCNDMDCNSVSMIPAESKQLACTANGRRLAAHNLGPTDGFTLITCGITKETVTFDIFGDNSCSGDPYMTGGQSVLAGCTKTMDGYQNSFCDAGKVRMDTHAVAGCTDAASTAGDAGMEMGMCVEGPAMMEMPMYVKPTAGLPCTVPPTPSAGGDSEDTSDAMVTAKLGWVAAAAVVALAIMQQ